MTTASLPAPAASLAWVTPRHLVAGLITATLVLAEWQFRVIDGPARMVVALGSCLVVERVLGWFVLGQRVSLVSAWVSATSLTVLLRPLGGALWPYVVGALLAIGSKYALRYRGRHLWNPTNLAVCVLLLVAAPEVSVLSDQWGNTWVVNAVVWTFGLLVVHRAGVGHITLTWVGGFTALSVLRAWALGLPVLGELAPLTGPMYQLMAFFMMTDPRTLVASRRGQIGVALAICVVEAVLRTGLSLGWAWTAPFGPAPALYALTMVGPAALAFDLWRRGQSGDTR